MSNLYLIIGLGNPGKKYEKTRHNVGFMAVGFLVGKQKWTRDKKSNTEIIKTLDYIVAKPQTFMNNSGQAVRAVADYYKIKPQNIIVIYDELDLPFGEIRIKNKGSAAGHNGIKSIIQHLGTDEFIRVRIGIKNDKAEKMDASKFVLKKFSRSEERELKNKVLPEVVENIKKTIKN